MANHKTAVRLDHLSKIYQDPKTGEDFYAVHDANITMEPGSFTCLLGPSGCGKTTILRMIAGFESPDEGEIYFDDQPVNRLTPNKRDTAMVFQSYALLPHYNIYDNIAYGLKLRKMDSATIKEKVTNIMHLVGLDGMEDRMTNQLSGGQQQRVALARAPWPPSRASCSSTSRSPTSTPSSAWTCAPRSAASSRRRASRPSTSRTTSPRPWPSPTRSSS